MKITEASTLVQKLRAGSHSFLAGAVIVALSILVSAAIAAPFYYSNAGQGEIRFTHDMPIHLSVMEQFDKVLRSGVIYPRWLPDVNYGYGNAWPNFYQPGFYYLTSLAHAITGNWIHSLFIITVMGMAASALAFYVLAREFTSKRASAVGAAVYALLPYHLVDVYWRGALPEYLSFVLLPLILYFFYRLGNRGQARYYAGLAVCYGSCIMIHIPISYLFSYILVVYALLWAGSQKDWRIAGRIGLGMAGGVLLSAIYWIPAIAEVKYAIETVTTLFEYHKNYITQLRSDDEYNHLLRETFAIQSAALLLVVAVIFWLRPHEQRTFNLSCPEGRTRTRFSHEVMWIAVGLLSIFMNLPLSYFIARLIPRIEVVAFPSRWLVFVCLFTSLLTATLAERLVGRVNQRPNIGLAYPVMFAVSAAVLALTLGFSVQFVIIRSLSSPMITRNSDFLVDSYCPNGAPAAASLPHTERIVVKSSSGTSEVIQWAPQYRQAVITTDEDTTARFKTFNFPGWNARVDGADTKISSDAFGAQIIALPQGRHTVEITFGSTPPRYLGAAFSVAGVFLVLGLGLVGCLRPGKQGQPHGSSSNSELSGKDSDWRESRQPQVIDDESAATSEAHQAIWPMTMVKRVANFSLLGSAITGVALSSIMLINDFKTSDNRAKIADSSIRSATGVGSDAKLSVGTSNVITVASDDLSLLEVIDAISRRDNQKLDQLVQSGRAFRVERDTRVRVLAFSGGKAKVEILDGDNASKQGSVVEGWLK